MSTPGVVTEQVFVAGEGLGFNPLSEQDAKKVQSNEDDWAHHKKSSNDKEGVR